MEGSVELALLQKKEDYRNSRNGFILFVINNMNEHQTMIYNNLIYGAYRQKYKTFYKVVFYIIPAFVVSSLFLALLTGEKITVFYDFNGFNEVALINFLIALVISTGIHMNDKQLERMYLTLIFKHKWKLSRQNLMMLKVLMKLNLHY